VWEWLRTLFFCFFPPSVFKYFPLLFEEYLATCAVINRRRRVPQTQRGGSFLSPLSFQVTSPAVSRVIHFPPRFLMRFLSLPSINFGNRSNSLVRRTSFPPTFFPQYWILSFRQGRKFKENNFRLGQGFPPASMV